ncbi:MAG: hypothetical protein O7B26_00285 [Planctomycetota bacterium]|nr:hypothetical protein [Planctomycetota bacterium]
MAMEVTVDRKKSEVQGAILQFAARREYRLFNAWWLDGQRLETQDPLESARHRPTTPVTRVVAMFRRVFDVDQRPRIDIELKSRRGKTTVAMDIGSHRKSVQLAYELRSYLEDERAYSCECPPICHRCSSAVRNMTARYCGQCGESLTAAEATRSRTVGESNEPEASRELMPVVVVEREDVPDGVSEPPSENELAAVDVEPDLESESDAGADEDTVADSRAATGLDESPNRGADDKPSEDTASETPAVMDDDGDEEEVGSRREASPGRRALAED